MAKIGNEHLIDPLLVDEIYDLGVSLSLAPCGIRTIGGSETDMIVLRHPTTRVPTTSTAEGLTRVESYTRFAAYTYTAIGDRSIGERSILGEQPKKGKKEKEVIE